MKPNTRRLLALETLEDRRLLSTCHVNRLTDTDEFATADAIELRRCIDFANNNPGPDAIKFAVHGVIFIQSALPILNSEISVEGPGAELLTVNGGNAFRVFTIGSAGNVRISGLTITNGRVKYNDYGAGIFNSGSLTISESKVTDNRAYPEIKSDPSCGGIYNSGTLVLNNSTVSKNVAFANGSAPSTKGGAICNYGVLTISGSAITDNSATIDAYFDTGSVWGGGIYSKGTLTVISSLVARNFTQALKNSYYAALGGGIFSDGTLTVTNSTIASNSAFGVFSEGGGLFTSGGTAMIRNSTIAQNSSPFGKGGGLYHSSGQLSMRNTIIAGNWADYGGNDLDGVLTSSGYNLFQDSDGGSGYDSTDLLDVNPKLGALQDNGGVTETIGLLPDSPAIDAGDPNITDAPEFDQRGPGFPRIVNGTIDIGAFEVQTTAAPLPTGARRGSPDPAVFITADFETEELKWRL